MKHISSDSSHQNSSSQGRIQTAAGHQGRLVPDEELIEGCLKGKSAAQYALYKRYGPQTFGICKRYSSDLMEAEDLHQIGWMRVFDKLGHYKYEGPLGAWMRKLFVNVCLTAFQKRKSTSQWITVGTDSEQAAIVSDPKPPSDFLELEQLANLISQLPEGPRLVFNLYAIDGMNHSEIAQSLQISEENSRQQLRRARLQLSQKLGNSHSDINSPQNHHNHSAL